MSGGASASASLLKWVATFSTVSKCSSLEEFSDGLSFYQLLCELTPEHTSGVTIDRSGMCCYCVTVCCVFVISPSDTDWLCVFW